MANEIQITLSMTVTNGYVVEKFQPGLVQVTQAAIGAHCPIWKVGLAEEDLSVGDITTLGYLMLRNLDTTNFVTYGPKSGGSMVGFGKLKAGEIALVRLLPGITIRAIADTAEVKLQVRLLQD